MRRRSKSNLELADSGQATAPFSEQSILETSASAVIEIIPQVMDSMRSSLRSHVGDQLTAPQFRCLAYISRNGGCTVSEVSSFMGVTNASASVH